MLTWVTVGCYSHLSLRGCLPLQQFFVAHEYARDEADGTHLRFDSDSLSPLETADTVAAGGRSSLDEFVLDG
jgi:hypothetical protein